MATRTAKKAPAKKAPAKKTVAKKAPAKKVAAKKSVAKKTPAKKTTKKTTSKKENTMSQKASLGRVVHVLVDPRENNGSDVAAALITRVLDTGDSDEVRVNVKAFLDGDTDRRIDNVVLVDSRPDEDDEVDEVQTAGERQKVAFWPPRS